MGAEWSIFRMKLARVDLRYFDPVVPLFINVQNVLEWKYVLDLKPRSRVLRKRVPNIHCSAALRDTIAIRDRTPWVLVAVNDRVVHRLRIATDAASRALPPGGAPKWVRALRRDPYQDG